MFWIWHSVTVRTILFFFIPFTMLLNETYLGLELELIQYKLIILSFRIKHIFFVKKSSVFENNSVY